ncbi:unnamed protein product [Mytilus edulis]|uniref:Mutator-like transposase domain-containing protein n=1 Tax=Mytilus edulis TaxID=6550 RepID=A0A8S3UWL5_MYTED|nr:unnamed protein product [Mytilus edulis]
MDKSVKVSLKSSDKGSYYNQEEYSSESDTTNSDSSLYSRENNLNSSVSFLKLTSPFEQSFEVEDIAAAASVAAAADNDDDNNDDESDKEMNITWEVNSNNENISDSDMSSDDQEDASVAGLSVDGSWAHVGYSSRFGFVSVISVDTGKVLDYVTLSNECKACKKWEREGKTHTRDFLQWFVEHEKDCTLNHDGSAKTMEAQGAVILFRRSEEKHSLQYTTYVGDGDSSAYGNVVDSRPYGPNIIIAKEDCVGHIQGRMGKHLRRLVDQYKGRKLEDGKQLTGKGRLTNKLMNSFQTFYGMAIRNNKGNVNAMRQNVMAILFHYASTAEKPMHHFCPVGDTSWCKWQVDKDCGSSTYRPLKNPLTEVVVQILKPVFEKLSDEKLLTGAEKCLTQNQNESLHHVIWSYLPKGEYHSAGEIQLGTALAVGHFNSGMANFNTKLFEKANISVGDNNKRLWINIDSTRIRHSLYKTSEKGKKRRKQLKAMEAQHQDTLQYDDSYAKDKYYKSSTSDNPSEKGKRQPKCKTCGKPMKGHKKQTCQINQIQ